MRFAVIMVFSLLLIGQVMVLTDAGRGEELQREVSVTSTLLTFQTDVIIPPGEDFTLTFRPREMHFGPKEIPPLGDECDEALSLVPEWMRVNLTHKFRLLSSEDRKTFANLIIDAPDERYRDEIGFVIAHSTPQTLTDDNFFPELITHNAELIYEHDKVLDYVKVVEKGDYTTLEYSKGFNQTIELPREDYYWFVVHPKLGDELPTYVDPDYDYTSDPPFDRDHGVDPPVGKYWRDWFFVYSKEGQPLLKDRLEGKNTTLDAIKAINGWISASMIFTSDNERPTQPVRIYVKGQGRCGEYQDMRSAAARSALIPVIATSNTAEDHVWNEFWDEEWYHWDGTINNPRMYENGWGKTISSVWNSRGDGYTWSVTPRYSDTATINAAVLDSNGLPVDGADIDIYTENFYQPDVRTVTYSAVTNSSGKVSMELGDNRNFWGTSDTTELGSDPINPLNQIEIAAPTSAGGEYDATFELPRAAPRLNMIQTGAPPVVPGGLNMTVTYEVISQITRGNARVASGRFDLYQDGGNIDFFIADSTNINAYRNGLPFMGMDPEERSLGGIVSIPVPPDEVLTSVLSNGFSQWTSKLVRINVTVTGGRYLSIDSPAPGEKIPAGNYTEITGTQVCSDDAYGVWISFDGGDEWESVDESFHGYPGEVLHWNHYWYTYDLPPGDYDILVKEARGNGSLVAGVRVRLIDTNPPRIRDTDLQERVPKGELLTVTGRVTDDSGVGGLEYYLDGGSEERSVELDPATGEFEISLSTIRMDIGSHEITLHAFDIYDNTVDLTLDFEVVESIAPNLLVELPTDDTMMNPAGTLDISGRVSDNGGEVSLSYMVDKKEVSVLDSRIDLDGSFHPKLPFKDNSIVHGRHMLDVTATDDAGNTETVERTFIVDGRAPTIELDGRTELVISPGSVIEVTGTASDDHGINRIGITVDGSELDDADLSYSGEFSFEFDADRDLSSGENLITFTVFYLVGNRDSAD
ncbi:MAG: transglutaminase domain-containing protein, partial [Thermoplasmatota archaeon]